MLPSGQYFLEEILWSDFQSWSFGRTWQNQFGVGKKNPACILKKSELARKRHVCQLDGGRKPTSFSQTAIGSDVVLCLRTRLHCLTNGIFTQTQTSKDKKHEGWCSNWQQAAKGNLTAKPSRRAKCWNFTLKPVTVSLMVAQKRLGNNTYLSRTLQTTVKAFHLNPNNKRDQGLCQQDTRLGSMYVWATCFGNSVVVVDTVVWPDEVDQETVHRDGHSSVLSHNLHPLKRWTGGGTWHPLHPPASTDRWCTSHRCPAPRHPDTSSGPVVSSAAREGKQALITARRRAPLSQPRRNERTHVTVRHRK